MAVKVSVAPTVAVGLEAPSVVEVEPGPTLSGRVVDDPATLDALSGVKIAVISTGDWDAANDV